jgi:hypothetical protein
LIIKIIKFLEEGGVGGRRGREEGKGGGEGRRGREGGGEKNYTKVPTFTTMNKIQVAVKNVFSISIQAMKQ